MAGPRKGWDELSPAYRKRLTGAGVTQSKYEAGTDLRKARGHGFKAPKPRGVSDEARRRIEEGQTTPDDRRTFGQARSGGSLPSWIPADPAVMDDQTAAILSTIRPAPNATDKRGRRAGWRDVVFIYNPDGSVTMTVTPIRGYAFDVQLPDRDAASQVQSVLRNLNTPGVDIAARGEGYLQPVKKAASRKAAAKKTPAKKTPAKKAAAKKAAAKKATASSSTAKKAAAKKAPAKTAARPTAKKTAAKPAARKQPARRPTVSRKAPAKKATRRPTAAPNLLDLLAEAIDTAIDTAGDAIDTATDTLGQ